MNRGADRKFIFHDEDFYGLFIDLLDEINDRFKIEIHSYCLMGNHYHLLLKTRHANLSRAMRHLNSVYTMRYNRLTGRDGPLFRGRFKSILVDSENYLLQVSRYIHLNPSEAGIVVSPEGYPWSSFKDYCNSAKKPKWLTINEILSRFNGKEKPEQYRDFVYEGIDEAIRKKYEVSRKIPIIGSEEFFKKIEKSFKITPKIEVPATKGLNSRYIVKSKIINQITNIYSVSAEDILQGKDRKLRKLAIYMCCKLTKETQAKLGEYFSNLSYSAISKIYRKIDEEMKVDNELRKEIEDLQLILSNFKT